MLRITFFRVWDVLDPTDPFQLIYAEKREALEKKLNRGNLHPDTQGMRGYTLLSIAIEHNKPEIITLLLQHGANPNLPEPSSGKNSMETITIGFHTREHGRALIQLLLTYGSVYEHVWDDVRKYYNKPGSSYYPKLTWMDSIREECYRVFDLQKQGQALFDANNYPEAKVKYEQAASLLERFAASDQESRRDVEYNKKYKGHYAYYNDYCIRADRCRTMIHVCKQRLTHTESSLEEVPLLSESKKTL